MNINTVKIQGDGYLVNGNISVPNDEDNRHYQEVIKWINEGGIVEDEFTTLELQEQAAGKFTLDIDNFIQDEVENLNASNNVKFIDIHNCKSYAMTDGYPLQTECQAITDWAFLTVWPHMREWQSTLTSIPTDTEFQAELDKIPFNG
jgi:hypothetical protein